MVLVASGPLDLLKLVDLDWTSWTWTFGLTIYGE